MLSAWKEPEAPAGAWMYRCTPGAPLTPERVVGQLLAPPLRRQGGQQAGADSCPRSLEPKPQGSDLPPLAACPLVLARPLHQHPLMPRWTLLSHASGFSRQDPPAPPGCGPGQPSVHGTRPYPILHSSPDQRSRADPLSAVSSDFSSHGHMATSTASVPEHKPAVDYSVM